MLGPYVVSDWLHVILETIKEVSRSYRRCHWKEWYAHIWESSVVIAWSREILVYYQISSAMPLSTWDMRLLDSGILGPHMPMYAEHFKAKSVLFMSPSCNSGWGPLCGMPLCKHEVKEREQFSFLSRKPRLKINNKTWHNTSLILHIYEKMNEQGILYDTFKEENQIPVLHLLVNWFMWRLWAVIRCDYMSGSLKNSKKQKKCFKYTSLWLVYLIST